MSLETVRTKLKTELEAISGMGVVHDYLRWSVNWKDYVDKFKSGGKINAAWLEVRSSVGDREAITNATARTWAFRLNMIMSLKDADATQKTFDSLVETVLNAMSPGDRTFGRAVQKAEPAELIDNDHLMHSEVFVHHAEIEIMVEDIIDD